MAMDSQLQNHSVQAVGTTLMFGAMIIFGFVFWKIFAGENTHLMGAQDEARTSSQVQAGPAVTRVP